MIDKEQVEKYGVNIIENDTITTEKQALINQIKQLLPNAINSDNQLDIKALDDLLGQENTTSNNQGYELTFAGKGLARAEADKNPEYELKTEKSQSKNFDTTKNTVIRGDNLEVLKILKANYHNKIKMIYIDPPYNTKSENFVYKDNFKKSDESLIEEFGLGDEAVDFLHNVYGTRSHSGWLSFIYPRLKLARELLTNDGVIFISIDDNEQANLKILCDEIFGEGNFVEIFKWNKTSTPPSLSNKVRQKYEFVLCYENKQTNNIFNSGTITGGDMPLLNTSNKLGILNIPKENVVFNFNGDFSKGIYDRVELINNIVITDGKSNNDLVLRGNFKWSQDTINNEIDNNTSFIIKTDKFAIRYIRQGERIKKPSDIISKTENNVGTNESANKELDILNLKGAFNNPKPTTLLKYLTNLCCNQNDTILDFFAGSGTTGDAVMQLNAQDGGSRKFVLVQLDEKIDKDKSKQAYDFCLENNFNPVISSITIERLNRTGDKILRDNENAKAKDKKDLTHLDIGYKVLSLNSKPQIKQDNNLFKVINSREKTIDTLINMLVATCKTFDNSIETIKDDLIYKIDNEIYLLGNVAYDEIKNFKDLKINIDGWTDINLEDFLNISVDFKDNISIIY
jgi:adenine-specific DNA-methyltransferase